MTDRKVIETTLDILIKIREIATADPDAFWTGICNAYLKILDPEEAGPYEEAGVYDKAGLYDKALVEHVMNLWPKVTADEWCDFPVPDPAGRDPYTAYFHHQSARTLWKGEYGALRFELLDFVIDELTARLK